MGSIDGKYLFGNRQMKICYPFCYSGGGGTEWHALYLAREARKSGHEAFFVLSNNGYLSEAIKKEGFSYQYIPMESSFNPFKVISSALKLKKYLKEKDIDIVHAHMLREHSLAILAKIFGANVRVIRTFHRTDQFNWKMKPLMWIYNKYTDAYIAISNYMVKHLADHGVRGLVELVYNGVTRIEAKKHNLAIGFMGRVVPEKGVLPFVVQNKEIFRKEKLFIGGVGEDLQELKSTLAGQKIAQVEILGRVNDVPGFFEKISVFVLPASHEVLPLVALEAFSCGVPVVAFDLPVLKEMIDGKNGFLIPQGDYQGLAKKALDLLHSPDLKSFQQSARDSYELNYTIEQMWSKTEALYKKVLG
jgi:glycosyltransferase involved in cell wall biosynthesis